MLPGKDRCHLQTLPVPRTDVVGVPVGRRMMRETLAAAFPACPSIPAGSHVLPLHPAAQEAQEALAKLITIGKEKEICMSQGPYIVRSSWETSVS